MREIVFPRLCKFLERIKSTLHVEVYEIDEMSLGKSYNYLLVRANGEFTVHVCICIYIDGMNIYLNAAHIIYNNTAGLYCAKMDSVLSPSPRIILKRPLWI